MFPFLIVVAIILFIVYVLSLPVFGKLPSGISLAKIKDLPNYSAGQINNLSVTPIKPDDVSYLEMFTALIKGNKNAVPSRRLPHLTPNFTSGEDTITWFGHSTYLIQVDGKNILVDPVFSERTSPFQFLGSKNFDGTNFFNVEHLPFIDIMVITHDHYDHLDYLTILALKPKTAQYITSLGVGTHLERWGIEGSKISEMAWGEQLSPIEDFTFIASSARHFSGRMFKRNQSAWSSFVFKTAKKSFYLGGDSGYDTHFSEIGKSYGPFDLAILECGQYNKMWPFIHMFPEQVLQAAIDLGAKCLLPVHWGKFKLALHDWDEPIAQLTTKANEIGYPISTPKLGETFNLDGKHDFSKWWVNF